MVPQDTSFRCAFHTSELSEGLETDKINSSIGMTFPVVGDSTFIPTKFSEARLVGCSMRVTYIGTRDDESGFLVAGHTFDTNPWLLSEDVIEESYMTCRAKPSQGVRMVYMPKDEKDLDFAPTNIRMNISQGNRNTFDANDFLAANN